MGLSERRRQTRSVRRSAPAVRVSIPRLDGGAEEVDARLVDISEGGVGIELPRELPAGAAVRVSSPEGIGGRIGAHKAQVRWCEKSRGGSYLAGLEFDDGVEPTNPRAASPISDEAPPDYYEVLQLSPNADAETIHRVFRALAQRYHPDNRQSGNAECFKQVLAAYETLSDPERRAAFDARRVDTNRLRWRIFHQPEAAVGVEAEKRKRLGVLSLLYTRRMSDARNPSMGIHEFEDMLGCPREHLEFTPWYLRENGLIAKLDNGRYGITVKGVDHAEAQGIWQPSTTKMLTAAEAVTTP